MWVKKVEKKLRVEGEKNKRVVKLLNGANRDGYLCAVVRIFFPWRNHPSDYDCLLIVTYSKFSSMLYTFINVDTLFVCCTIFHVLCILVR